MTDENKNMKIWDAVSKTDTRYTKTSNQGGRATTSINTVYMIKRATEALGPIGGSWGYEIIDERFDKTAPIALGNGELMVVDGETVWELDHTIRLRLWIGDKEDTVEQFGHTRYRYYSSKSKRIIIDSDYAKKTLSDAMKKCLSLLGVCADVFLGEFDDINYQRETSAAFEADRAIKKVESNIDAATDLRQKIKRTTENMDKSKSWHEVEALYTGIVTEIAEKGPLLGIDFSTEKRELDKSWHEGNARLNANNGDQS